MSTFVYLKKKRWREDIILYTEHTPHHTHITYSHMETYIITDYSSSILYSIDIDISSESLWPCVDYGRVRDSSLQLGGTMSWLLEPGWSRAWADRDITFCDSFYRNPQTLQHFLKFTQVWCHWGGDPSDCVNIQSLLELLD